MCEQQAAAPSRPGPTAATVAGDVDHLHPAEAIRPRITVAGHADDVVTGPVEPVARAGAQAPGEGGE